MTTNIVDAAVRVYVATCLRHDGVRPTLERVASFRALAQSAFERFGYYRASAPPAPPAAPPPDDDDEPTRPTRPHPRPPR